VRTRIDSAPKNVSSEVGAPPTVTTEPGWKPAPETRSSVPPYEEPDGGVARSSRRHPVRPAPIWSNISVSERWLAKHIDAGLLVADPAKLLYAAEAAA
jgi:hypothetical protein